MGEPKFVLVVLNYYIDIMSELVRSQTMHRNRSVYFNGSAAQVHTKNTKRVISVSRVPTLPYILNVYCKTVGLCSVWRNH